MMKASCGKHWMQQVARENLGAGEEKVIYHKDEMSIILVG